MSEQPIEQIVQSDTQSDVQSDVQLDTQSNQHDNQDTENLLDEELENQIKETQEELNSIENPGSIESGLNVDPKMIEEFYENIRKMPRDQLTKLLANMGRKHSNLGTDHQFGTISENVQKSAKEKLRMKLDTMNMKRKKKVAIEQEMQKISNRADQEERLVPVNTKQLETNDSQDNECEFPQKVKMSKGQKKRARKNAKKLTNIPETIDENSEMTWSDTESNENVELTESNVA